MNRGCTTSIATQRSRSLHDCLPIEIRSLSKPAAGDPRLRFGLRSVGKGKFILYRDLDSGYVKARRLTAMRALPIRLTGAAALCGPRSNSCAMLAEQAGLKADFRLCDDGGGKDFDHAITAMDYVDGRAR